MVTARAQFGFGHAFNLAAQRRPRRPRPRTNNGSTLFHTLAINISTNIVLLDYTQNPFASTHSLETNPFDDPVPSSAEATRLEQLRQRELDLERREAELNKKAEHIRTHGKNNWPFCQFCLSTSVLPRTDPLPSRPRVNTLVFPLIFHSIQDEIPEASRPLITRLYQLWLVLLGTLILNMIACIFILLAGSSDGGRDLGGSIG